MTATIKKTGRVTTKECVQTTGKTPRIKAKIWQTEKQHTKTSNMQILKRLMLIWTTRNSFAFLCYQVNRKFALFLPINRLKFDYGNRFFQVGTPVVLVFIRLGLVDSIESLFISEIRPDYDTNLR